MSLTGNLEDLPLLDILQIVTFSKKTGYLGIRMALGEGAIVFRDGFVVAAFTPESPPLDPRAATLPPDKRETLIRGRIEMALEHLIRLREGQFNFSLSEEAPRSVGPRDISGEILENGINPQQLLLDLARGMDEDRRDSTAALEAGFAEPESFESDMTDAAPAADTPPVPFAPGSAPDVEESAFEHTLPSFHAEEVAPARGAAPPAAPAPAAAEPPAEAKEIRTVLLVDDEEDVRQLLATRFREAGYDVHEAEDPDTAIKVGGKLGKAGPFVLVTDLGMPTSGGSSFQGGFEVVKRLTKMNLHPPVLMMTENLSGSVRARAKQMGISSFIFKPGLSKLDSKQFEADLRAFASKILNGILPELSRGGTPVHRKAPARASAAPVAPPPPVSGEELSRQFALLERRLEELRRPSDATQISALVMKVAREFFERGILFLVKNEEARGLGGFGPAPREESLNLLVREVVIPLGEPSVFVSVAVNGKPFSGPLPDGKWTQYLMGRIGRFKSDAAALFPLQANRDTIAVLYGDNPETGRPFSALEVLNVFVKQAGVALENAFLQRKIQALQPRE